MPVRVSLHGSDLPMTTPAQNISYMRPISFSEKRYDAAGNIVSQRTSTDDVNVWRRRRPASVTMTRRADKTRPPGNWWSEWQHTGGFKGSLEVVYDPIFPDSHRGVVRGNLALIGDPVCNTAMVDPLMRNARLDALAKLSADTMQFNAALAQANGTLKLAADFSTAAAAGLDDLMRDQFDEPLVKSSQFAKRSGQGLGRALGRLSNWKQIPNRYLAYLYGIAPLADDLANATTQLVKYKTDGFDMSVVLRGSEKRTETCTHNVALHNGSGGSLYATISGLRKMQARCGYRFDVPSWYLDRAPIVSTFSTAYELTKMSFVLDWFLPVGNWIGAMESAQWSAFFVEGWETAFIRDTYTALQPASRTSIFDPLVSVQSSGSFEKGAMSRSAVWEYPSTLLTRPALNPLPSWPKAAQGLSLLTQAFQRWY